MSLGRRALYGSASAASIVVGCSSCLSFLILITHAFSPPRSSQGALWFVGGRAPSVWRRRSVQCRLLESQSESKTRWEYDAYLRPRDECMCQMTMCLEVKRSPNRSPHFYSHCVPSLGGEAAAHQNYY